MKVRVPGSRFGSSRLHKATISSVSVPGPILQETGLAAYHAVKLRDYGRIDMRLTPKGEVYVIEANPNPWLSSKQEFAMAAKASGRSYTQLIGEIVDMAMQRYAPRSGSETIA